MAALWVFCTKTWQKTSCGLQQRVYFDQAVELLSTLSSFSVLLEVLLLTIRGCAGTRSH